MVNSVSNLETVVKISLPASIDSPKIHHKMVFLLISKQNIIKSEKMQLNYTQIIQEKQPVRKREQVKKIIKLTKHIKI